MQSSLLHYSAALSLVIMLTALKAYTAFLVVRLLRKIDLEQPFSLLVSRLIFKISKVTLEVGILALVGRSYFLWLLHNQVAPAQLAQFIPEGTVYLFLACIIFVIAQIFKRGVTLQTENELTV